MRLRNLGALLLLVLSPCLASRASALDKEAKAWLDEVGPIILPEEEEAYRKLEDRSDLEEFRRIFWARRNPNGAAAAENPYKAGYEKLKPAMDERFRIRGRKGTETDCGRAVMLLGEPAEIKVSEHAVPPARGTRTERRYEIWIFEGPLFRNGSIAVSLDEQCSAPLGFHDELEKVARSLVVNREVGYERGPGRHLIKLDDQLSKVPIYRSR